MTSDAYRRTPIGAMGDIHTRLDLLERRLAVGLPARLRSAGSQVSDWNDAVESGFYWSDGAANSPTGPGIGTWFVGMVLYHEDAQVQIVWEPTQRSLPFQRYRYLGLESAWSQTSLPQATETIFGSVRRATQAEVTAGTDSTKYVSPLTMKTATDASTAAAIAAALAAYVPPTPPDTNYVTSGVDITINTSLWSTLSYNLRVKSGRLQGLVTLTYTGATVTMPTNNNIADINGVFTMPTGWRSTSATPMPVTIVRRGLATLFGRANPTDGTIDVTHGISGSDLTGGASFDFFLNYDVD